MENLIVGIIIAISIYFTAKRLVNIFKGEKKCNCSQKCINSSQEPSCGILDKYENG